MAISQLEFALWLLGNFVTVKKVREALKMESFPLVFDKKLLQYTFELHYFVIDKTGESIIIVFTDQGRKIHENRVGVMTNSPPYDFHMLNLRSYVQLSKYYTLTRTLFFTSCVGSVDSGLPKQKSNFG